MECEIKRRGEKSMDGYRRSESFLNNNFQRVFKLKMKVLPLQMVRPLHGSDDHIKRVGSEHIQVQSNTKVSSHIYAGFIVPSAKFFNGRSRPPVTSMQGYCALSGSSSMTPSKGVAWGE